MAADIFMPVPLSLIMVILVLGSGAALSVAGKKLTPVAGACAFVTGLCIYAGAGPGGLAVLAAFFMMATIATAHKKAQKAELEAKPRHQERRKAGQVFANGGVAALMGIAAMLLPQYHTTIALMITASISAATADTLSSELGMVYGRNPFNILSFKSETKGLDGVVSIEGTLCGIGGALIIAGIYAAFTGFDPGVMLIIVAAGAIGNLADSVLGAWLERKHMVGNNTVNTLNTLCGAIAALGLLQLLS